MMKQFNFAYDSMLRMRHKFIIFLDHGLILVVWQQQTFYSVNYYIYLKLRHLSYYLPKEINSSSIFYIKL